MIGKYAYSFDRETFRGAFNSRQEALKAALTAAGALDDSPAAIYVACRAPIDPHASGHSEVLVERMRDCVRDEIGETGEPFLKLVSDQEMADLDDAVERAIRGWLIKHDLLLASGRLSAISEYPVPAVAGVAQSGGYREVSEIGEG